MAALLSIDVDPSGVIKALDRLGAAVEQRLQDVAQETAQRIAEEARRRVARRTGQTASFITAEPARDGKGWVVYVKIPADQRNLWPNIDIGLEFGTRYMVPRPFLHPSVSLEAGPHRRRLEAAIQAAIEEAQR